MSALWRLVEQERTEVMNLEEELLQVKTVADIQVTLKCQFLGGGGAKFLSDFKSGNCFIKRMIFFHNEYLSIITSLEYVSGSVSKCDFGFVSGSKNFTTIFMLQEAVNCVETILRPTDDTHVIGGVGRDG